MRRRIVLGALVLSLVANVVLAVAFARKRGQTGELQLSTQNLRSENRSFEARLENLTENLVAHKERLEQETKKRKRLGGYWRRSFRQLERLRDVVCFDTEYVTGSPFTRPGVSGDVDGDGTSDRLRVVAEKRGSADCVYWLEVEGSKDVTSVIDPRDVADFDLKAGLAIEAIADLDGDGAVEILVEQHRGASTEFGSIYRLVGDALARVSIEGTHGDEFAYYGSVGHGSAVDCAAHPLNQVIYSSYGYAESGRGYRVTRRFYALEGDRLVITKTEHHRLKNGRLGRFSEFKGAPLEHCPGYETPKD